MSEIVERFSRILRDDPHRPLLHLPSVGATLTARDLWMRAASIRDRIAGAKLHRDRPLLSLAGNRAESVALLLACRMAGKPLMPVDASTPAAEVLDFSTRFSASALVRPSEGAAPAGATVTALCAGLELVVFPDCGDAPTYPDAAVLKLTSGTTGLPKATVTSEAALVADTYHITEAMGIGPDDTQLAAIPLSHAYGLGNLAVTLLVQGTAIVMRDAFVPHQLRADAERYGARAVSRRSIHVRSLRREPARGRLASGAGPARQRGCASRSGNSPAVPRSLRRKDSFLLRHDRSWWHRLRRQ